MEVKAVGRRIRVQPRKVRLVANEIRGKHAIPALAQLRYHPSKSARVLHKVLKSAIANAVENNSLGEENLIVSNVIVDEAPRLRRMETRAMGRGNIILKRSSHVTVILREGEAFELPKSNAKPKPRPKFEAPAVKKEKKKETAEEPIAEAAQEMEATQETAETPDEIEQPEEKKEEEA
jgi:large subunit ribosomal protein L22